MGARKKELRKLEEKRLRREVEKTFDNGGHHAKEKKLEEKGLRREVEKTFDDGGGHATKKKRGK